MRFKLLVATLVLASLALTFSIFKSDIVGLTDQGRVLLNNDPAVVLFKRDAQALKNQVFTATPLRVETKTKAGDLSVAGIIALTNKERQATQAVVLKESPLLRQAAEAKLEDMFNRQYFEHQSPDGKGPGDLATAANYHYIIVGENLALGNFGSDAALLAGWMASPGHRENILRASYREIGVAARKGLFEGKMTWLAVQEFGTAQTACPQITAELSADIENGKTELEVKEVDLASRAQSIDAYEPKRGDAYTKLVNDYNIRVEQYNILVVLVKKNIALYNTEVQNYNICLASFSK